MLTFNKLTGVFVRRRHSFSTEFLLVLWFLLYLIVNLPTSDTLFTTAFRIQHDPHSSNFPGEYFTISGTPTTPAQLLQSLSQATTQAVLARANRAANPNRGVATPTAPVPAPVFVPVPAPGPAPAGTYFSDSEDEDMAQLTMHEGPLSYKSAFNESEFVLRQAMKARIAQQGTRTEEELLAFQTDLDLVVESAQLNPIQMQKFMELQTSTRDLGPIKANTHMQNKRMAAAKWSATKDSTQDNPHGSGIAHPKRQQTSKRKNSADSRRRVP